MKKRVSDRDGFTIRLTCGYCGKLFRTNRWRKYCKPECARLANISKGKMRYQEMRRIVYKARGKNKQ